MSELIKAENAEREQDEDDNRKSTEWKFDFEKQNMNDYFTLKEKQIDTLRNFNISKKVIVKTLPKLSFPGRFNYLKKGRIKKMLHKKVFLRDYYE